MKIISLARVLVLPVSLLLVASCDSSIGQDAMPAVGAPAPVVSGSDQDGKAWKLSDLKGQRAVLLYFYPKDDTPGCTRQACGFRDEMEAFKAAGVEVVGVSFDSAERHREFIGKHELTFDLLADTDGRIADAFGVRAGNSPVARRVSFLIDRQGVIRHITDSPSAAQHLKEMKEAVGKLSQ